MRCFTESFLYFSWLGSRLQKWGLCWSRWSEVPTGQPHYISADPPQRLVYEKIMTEVFHHLHWLLTVIENCTVDPVVIMFMMMCLCSCSSSFMVTAWRLYKLHIMPITNFMSLPLASNESLLVVKSAPLWGLGVCVKMLYWNVSWIRD